jgi:hypothetical protein
MKREKGRLGPEFAKRKFEELKPLAESVLSMGFGSLFSDRLRTMMREAGDKLSAETPESPVNAFDEVRRILNNKTEFEMMLKYLHDEKAKEFKQMRNELNQLDSICRRINWPKPQRHKAA